jgi:hypothetical protein
MVAGQSAASRGRCEGARLGGEVKPWRSCVREVFQMHFAKTTSLVAGIEVFARVVTIVTKVCYVIVRGETDEPGTRVEARHKPSRGQSQVRRLQIDGKLFPVTCLLSMQSHKISGPSTELGLDSISARNRVYLGVCGPTAACGFSVFLQVDGIPVGFLASNRDSLQAQEPWRSVTLETLT